MLQEKNVLVTGANRGIGKEIVKSCMAHGAIKVYAAVRDLDTASALVDAYGDRLVPVELDISKPETVAAAAETASDVQLVGQQCGRPANCYTVGRRCHRVVEV